MDDALKPIPPRRRPKKAPPSPLTRALANVLPWVVRGLALALPLILAAGALYAFRSFYYGSNPAFAVRPEDVVVRGNSTLTREHLLQIFKVLMPEPWNGFALLRSDIVERLRRQSPILRQVQMTYSPGRQLELWVEERTPLARLPEALSPLVVDEEGVVFVYPRPTGGYPLISGFDLPEALEPGARLPEALCCMLRLLAAADTPGHRLPSSVRRVSLLGNDPEDGLAVTLADGRRLIVAWEGMGSERATSEAMLRRLRNLGVALRSPVNAGKRHFNAMARDFVAVSE